MNRCVHIALIVLNVLITEVALGQAQPVPKSRQEQELLDLYQDGNISAFEERLLSTVNSDATAQDKAIAFITLVNAKKENSKISGAVVDKAYEIVKQLRPQLNPNMQYKLDHYRVDRPMLLGDMKEAAQAAQQLRKEWETQTERVLMVYSEEPVLFCRAGMEQEALKIVSDTWLNYPNNYLRNEAVRLRLAEFLADRHDYDTAFALLEELRESFPAEFRSNPYATQNWLNYAVRAKLADNENDKRKRLLDIAEYGRSAVASKEYDRVRDAVSYCLGEIYERASDVQSAKKFYETAKTTAGEGQMADNVRKWSQRSIDDIDHPKPEHVAETPQNVQPRLLQQHFLRGSVIAILSTILAILIVIFVVRRVRRMRG